MILLHLSSLQPRTLHTIITFSEVEKDKEDRGNRAEVKGSALNTGNDKEALDSKN